MGTSSLIAILAAGLTSSIIGAIWYNKYIFGSIWMRYCNFTPEMTERSKRRTPVIAVVVFLANMLIAYVMQSVSIALNTYSLTGAFVVGLWCWIGFVLPVLISSVLWEQKPFGYFLIHAAYWFVSFISIGMVLFYVAQLFAPTYS